MICNQWFGFGVTDFGLWWIHIECETDTDIEMARMAINTDVTPDHILSSGVLEDGVDPPLVHAP